MAAALNLTSPVTAQNVLSQDAETALKAQADHFASVIRRGRQVYYPPQFDLSGLPHYRPEHILEGWIRIHGDNYLADGQLGEFWRQGFAKFQPGLRISYYLPTAASGFGGLYYEPGGPYVTPTLATLQDRSYRLFQANYWYVNRVPGQPLDPKVKAFLTYVLSREGQAEVVRDGKYLPLNRSLVTAALKALQ